MPESVRTNRLVNEKSPYLLQHAHNPVDWYPWGNEAFSKAKAEDKPVFLSIGYSTCHWCHVMAHESFEDTEVAAVLNKNFISIKVDREERPDVDAVYMSFCQALTGSGGWPLTVLMTPGQKPFWAGTYLPKTPRRGLPGLLDLLNAAAHTWETDRKRLTAAGDTIVSSVLYRDEKDSNSFSGVGRDTFRKAYLRFQQTYDERWGGFGSAPKFPVPLNLMFLLKYAVLEKDTKAQMMAEYSLTQMYRGGIFDHVGGGFSRYSTDEKWLVPHFEKMLYDNALLSEIYLETFSRTKLPLYRLAAERTIGYVFRELTSVDGGFYCGQDADSDGVEGKYYTFVPEEIRRVLGAEDGNAFCGWFGITTAGNFEGKNIPNLIENSQYDEINPRMDKFCAKLYEYRLKRTKLQKDDKVLTAWNALMIAALSDAWRILRKPEYLSAAEKAWKFVKEHLTDKNLHVYHRWRNGESAGTGQLDDYAFTVFALLKLYDATFNADYLLWAEELCGEMIEHFFDGDKGGFFLYADYGERLVTRPKEIYDGAVPSGNSVAALILVRIARLTGEKKWTEYKERQLDFLCADTQRFPDGHSAALLAFMNEIYSSGELVCVTADTKVTAELESFLKENDFPLLSVLVKTKENQHALEKAAPFTGNYPFPKNEAAYYLCRNGTCNAPVYNLRELKKLLYQ